ncbi:MAG: RibD family protein [Gammaproteobacteria bacterium]|nr:RibD family protein [Gammaproteobacteria bacterium]
MELDNNSPYGPLLEDQPHPPQVIAQLGQSLDGRIATATGHSHYVTGQADRVHLHQLRALCDAVLIGPGTLIKDNPQLTVRHVDGPNPLRVVMAPRVPFDTQYAVFNDFQAPTLLLLPPDQAISMPDHIECLSPQPYTPQGILRALAKRGVQRLLVEGGATTVSAWFAADLLDWLFLTIAPVVIGAGPTGLSLPPITHMDQAKRLPVERFALDEDVLFRLDCRVAKGREAPAAR